MIVLLKADHSMDVQDKYNSIEASGMMKTIVCGSAIFFSWSAAFTLEQKSPTACRWTIANWRVDIEKAMALRCKLNSRPSSWPRYHPRHLNVKPLLSTTNQFVMRALSPPTLNLRNVLPFARMDMFLSKVYRVGVTRSVLIEVIGDPCKIVEMSTSKTGKHGHAKVHLVGIHVGTFSHMQRWR